MNASEPQRMPRLSTRLALIVDMVPPSDTVYDVGSDHALVPAQLVRLGICRIAYAGDVRPGPLRVAEKRIRAAGLDDRVKPVLSDGLDAFHPHERDTVVLAGLGGNEMIRILSRRPDGSDKATYILQPMKSAPELRGWLDDNGFQIIDERLSRDGRRVYCVLRVVYAPDPARSPLNDLERYVGPVLLKNRPPLFAAYIGKILDQAQKQLRGRPELKPIVRWLETVKNGEE